jgi:5'(3')-deoxyribonucleotidase
MILGLDFDGTINDMLDTWVEWLNKKHKTNIKVSDITEWELIKVFPTLTKRELFEPLNTPAFWQYVSIKPDAIEIIEKLIQDGHKIYIITSSHYRTLPAKLDKCLFAHFPFLKKENVIITYDKSLINCNLLLDDAEHNLINFKGIKVLFDASYNKNSTVHDFRISSWTEFYELVQELKNVGIGEKHNGK